MDSSEAMAWGGVIGGVVTAIGGAVVLILRQTSRAGRTARRDVVTNYQEILDRQQEWIKRLDEQVQRQQRVISKFYGALVEYREAEISMYGILKQVHDAATRAIRTLREMGRPVEEIPPLPDRPDRDRSTFSEEFEVRTTAQDSMILGKVAEKMNGGEASKSGG